MRSLTKEIFALENYEGPLDFLLYLIQNQELNIQDICLQKIMEQYLDKIEKKQTSDSGAEFISIAAFLHCLKSRTLLPRHSQLPETEVDDEFDPKFEIIHQLVEYCRLKEAAKELAEREKKQSHFYLRGIDEDIPEFKKNLGIEHLSLESLASLFQSLIIKASSQTKIIVEEIWRVSDKIKLIRQLLEQDSKVNFELLFSQDQSREELIVTFLAILELMKLGELLVAKENSTNKIIIFSCS